MKKKILAFLTTLGLAISLAACGAKAAVGGNAAEDSDEIVLRVCFSTGMTGAVNNFAMEKGLYEAEGIKFENVQTSGAANDTVLSLLSRGEIDIADGDPSTYIPGIYNGVPAKLVGNMWRYSGCYWLIANDDIAGIEDLAGRTIGTQGTAGGMRLSVLKMLESVGLTEADVTLIANGAYQDAYATFTSGSVDATIIHNPYAVLA
ncbi:MAG: ABC transporter substrate-binding protein, partial [Lachnospiraceae bacterium]|nr:ABC transporter substrate-binding protein [Lachnospiraceae bacterium]